EEDFGDAVVEHIKQTGSKLGADAQAELIRQGVTPAEITVKVRAHVRYAGTDTPLIVDVDTPEVMKAAFERAHQARFGFVDQSKILVVEAVSVEAIGAGAKFMEPEQAATVASLPSPTRRTRFYSVGAWHEAAVFLREQLAPGHQIDGPGIIIEPHQTVVVES